MFHQEEPALSCLMDLSGDVVPLRLLNLTDQSPTVYQDTITAWCEPVERVSKAGRREAQTSEAPAGRASQITPCTTSLLNHLVDLYQRTSSYLGETQKVEVEALLVEVADVFARSADDLGRTSIVSHEINTRGTRPICQHPRHLPLSQRMEAEAEIVTKLQRGVIEPSSSPWASPIVLVRKKVGTTCFCVDYRRLNAATVKDSYPLPHTGDSLEALFGSCWFSTLDLASGYWEWKYVKRIDPRQHSQWEVACTSSP